MPKASLAFWLPAMDWKMRSAGAPWEMAAIWVVTCPRTQVWVGMEKRRLTSSNRLKISPSRSVESVTGLSPSTASPAPKLKPSSKEARMPSGSSVVWLG